MASRPAENPSTKEYTKLQTERTHQPVVWLVLGALLLLLCAAGDFANFNQTVESLLAGTAAGWLILLLSLFGTAVAVALPVFLARYARERSDGLRSRSLPMLIAMAVAWLLVIGGVTYVRFVNEVGSATAESAPSGGIAGTTADLTIQGGGIALTVFLTVLLLATGVIGFALGWTGHDTREQIYRRSADASARTGSALADLNELLPRAELAAAEARRERDEVQRQVESALARIDAIAGRYRQIAREEIARRLQDPSATSALLLPVDEARAAQNVTPEDPAAHGPAVENSAAGGSAAVNSAVENSAAGGSASVNPAVEIPAPMNPSADTLAPPLPPATSGSGTPPQTEETP